MKMRLPYGFTQSSTGEVDIDKQHADVVKLIYNRYLSGDSLGVIGELLFQQRISSPSEKPRWTRAAIDKLLSNSKYRAQIISFEQFIAVQFEKDKRTNLDYDRAGHSRKSNRYHSKNVLSGLLVCAECGANYRRITPSNGAVIWRCGNRVEHGKAICREALTIKEEDIIAYIRDTLKLEAFDPQAVKEAIESIAITKCGDYIIEGSKSQLAYSSCL